MAKLFEPSTDEIIAAFEQQRTAVSAPVTVGSSPLVSVKGLSLWIERVSSGWRAASDWLYDKLMEHMNTLDICFCRAPWQVQVSF